MISDSHSNIVSLQDFRRRKSTASLPPKSVPADTIIYTMSRQILDMTILINHLGEQLSTLKEENETLAARIDGQRKIIAAMVEKVFP